VFAWSQGWSVFVILPSTSSPKRLSKPLLDHALYYDASALTLLTSYSEPRATYTTKCSLASPPAGLPLVFHSIAAVIHFHASRKLWAPSHVQQCPHQRVSTCFLACCLLALSPERATLRKPGPASGGLAQHCGAASAQDDGL
jgi:hypothetical protein